MRSGSKQTRSQDPSTEKSRGSHSFIRTSKYDGMRSASGSSKDNRDTNNSSAVQVSSRYKTPSHHREHNLQAVAWTFHDLNIGDHHQTQIQADLQGLGAWIHSHQDFQTYPLLSNNSFFNGKEPACPYHTYMFENEHNFEPPETWLQHYISTREELVQRMMDQSNLDCICLAMVQPLEK